ncbi:DUF3857 domain-containing protein [Paracidobacterium acidisoli]|uniref:DUF3857 domain-containing protein n=1 Tax=Paracidobacterium acidisoli TaxID=2303751 RepID=A0A372IUC2_9BACT|nr:DUF3857 domain-containing protein [Paracidobacterium acidisoli]MBT9329994.1 DUF3857 and transglutaminase domain-containing protein [Paracidobacterium acidisoli]
MLTALRRSVCVSFLLFASFPALAAPTWTQPTPEELKMTADPAAPNAPAVYLFREETVDDKLHFHSLYARIKVLTEKGKDYADVEIPYEAHGFTIRNVEGRTIHSDGTIVPFTGRPMDKLLMKSGDRKVMEKVFSMPDVQVGSIIEYRYVLAYDDNLLSSPEWYVQQPIYVHKAHYHFIPFDMSGSRYVTTRDSQGHEDVASRLLYFQHLPHDAKVTEGFNGFDLAVDDIEALPDEPFMPPMHSLSYRVLFYYSPFTDGVQYWKTEGKYWSKNVDHFATPSDKLKSAVSQMVAPGDTDEQKLQKIYAAVMKLENTSFTRTHTAEENKAEGLRVKTADDIWEQKRGYDDQIARLFLAMVRAAGMKAYAMAVTNRDESLFNAGYLSWRQMDDEIVIVNAGGKEEYFDPGQRYCEFGKLSWKHTETAGIRQTDNGTEITTTPGLSYKDNATRRYADIQLDPDGKVHGDIRILFAGAQALRWRHAALRNDEEEVKKDFEDELQRVVPPGITVKTDHFVGLNDYTTALMVMANISGTMGTATGKRVFLPGSFFEAGEKPRFPETTRETPIDLNYASDVADQVTIKLPANMTVESTPQDTDIPVQQLADYVEKCRIAGNSINYGRAMLIGTDLFYAKEYTTLRDFYQKASAHDQEPLVLKVGPMPVATTATTSVKPQ